MRKRATRAVGTVGAAIALAIGGAGVASANRDHPEDGPHHSHHHGGEAHHHGHHHGGDDHGHHGPNHT